MGRLINGNWVGDEDVATARDGAFVRADTVFRNWVTPDGRPGPSGEGGFAAESGRYHLYVSYACPWAHRTLIFRQLKDLADHVDVSVVHPFMGDEGWTFATDFPGTTGDRVNRTTHLRDIYLRADPLVTSRASVPVLWDKKRELVVSNESSEIIRMFNTAFNEITGNTADYWPAELQEAIERVNERIYSTLNNGVYRCGFAKSQGAYDAAAVALFDTLDWLERTLAENRYLVGAQITEADWRLFPTLARFDLVYHTHFKCNRARIVEYTNLWAYTRELFQWPGIAGTTRFDHIVHHYYTSHESINPYRIIPLGPEIDWHAPHGRG